MAEQNRAHPRVKVRIAVKVRTTNGAPVNVGQIHNISLGGVFIESDQPVAFGTDLDVEFALPSGVIRCKGFVVWSTKTGTPQSKGFPGMGVRLAQIGVQEMRHLAAFIEDQLKA